ncbi:hypothetical protein GGS23DRAFT_565773 [Durotheca rogersii]|uniref:uncharacterized protein n=1 Tax=Durotheca rogersii TaxID=419775 RepID=UPI00221E7616|nr:uncharacterized protein GGS23DRAFT_565773 [Durotheca rogersii]KAI5863868.1 hypothetical protein GGS23DRAFT_565773 [Durotheca rogersii]
MKLDLVSPTTPRLQIDSQPPPLPRKRAREATSEEPTSSQQSAHASLTPSPNPQIASDSISGQYQFSFSRVRSASPSDFGEDLCAEDVSHVLIKARPLSDENVSERLLELIVLAKRAKDLDVLKIGPWKLSHSALSVL